MIAHGPRHTYSTGRTLGLKTRGHIHGVTVQIGPIGNCVANIDTDAEADCPVNGLIRMERRKFLLHLYSTAYSAVDAIEHHEQGITAGLNDPAAMPLDRRVDQIAPKCAQAAERPWSSNPIRRL